MVHVFALLEIITIMVNVLNVILIVIDILKEKAVYATIGLSKTSTGPAYALKAINYMGPLAWLVMVIDIWLKAGVFVRLGTLKRMEIATVLMAILRRMGFVSLAPKELIDL